MNVESDPPHETKTADGVAERTFEEHSRPKPWGFWMTIVFTLLILLTFFAVQLVALVAHIATTEPPPGATTLEKRVDLATKNGDVVSLLKILEVLVVPAVCVLFAWLKSGISVREYLALRRVSASTCAVWLGVAVGLAVGLDFGTWLAGRQVVPDVMLDFYRSASYVPLLWLAVVVAAPISEEFVFRGFTFVGLQESWLGTYGTIFVTAIVFAVIHLQYNLAGILSIFVVGLLLGIARVRSNSLFVPIAMHAIHNLIAMLELVYVIHNKQVVATSEWPTWFAPFC